MHLLTKNYRPLSLWATLALSAGLSACTMREAPVAQTGRVPSDAIAGTYQARRFTENGSSTPYPINNQTVTMTIKRLTSTSIQVTIQATANGKYSPGRDLSYTDVNIVGNTGGSEVSSYFVQLSPTADCGYNTLYIYPNRTVDYNFVPPGNAPCSGAQIRFEKQ